MLHSLLFDFLNMKTGVCFPRMRTLQEKLQPWFSRAAIFPARLIAWKPPACLCVSTGA